MFIRSIAAIFVLGVVGAAGDAGDSCKPVPCDDSARCRTSKDIVGGVAHGSQAFWAEAFALEKLREAIQDSTDNPGCEACEFKDTCTDEVFVRESAAVGEATEEMGIYSCVKTLPKGSVFTVSCSACVDHPHVDRPNK